VVRKSVEMLAISSAQSIFMCSRIRDSLSMFIVLYCLLSDPGEHIFMIGS